jgi:hypothetical protein
MPFYLVILGFVVLCAVHVVKTRRPLYWVFIILAIPGLGSLVYFISEMLPDLLHSREARQAVRGARKAIDPERDYRALADQFDTVDTIANRQALAEECLRLGKSDQAITLYQGALAGIHKTDPVLMHALARAYFAAGEFARCTRTLEDLRAANPKFESAEAHLLYARSLEAEGRRGEALPEYEAVSGYFAGAEARCRYALLLRETGEAERARRLFEDVVRAVDKAGGPFKRSQREWYDIAKRNLA